MKRKSKRDNRQDTNLDFSVECSNNENDIEFFGKKEALKNNDNNESFSDKSESKKNRRNMRRKKYSDEKIMINNKIYE